MQRSSSNVDQIIAEYSYNRSAYEPSHITPVKRPNSHRDDRGPFDTIPLPPLSRTTSQASANSMASTTFLLDQHRHPSTVAKRSTGFHWPHPFQTRKERYSGEDFDAEKLSPVDSGGGGGGGGRADDTGAQGVDGNRNGKVVMKPWHGWREVLFGSCQYIPCRTSSVRAFIDLHFRVQPSARFPASIGKRYETFECCGSLILMFSGSWTL